jgi:hypothetical protein
MALDLSILISLAIDSAVWRKIFTEKKLSNRSVKNVEKMQIIKIIIRSSMRVKPRYLFCWGLPVAYILMIIKPPP